jgi:hypothetical protein
MDIRKLRRAFLRVRYSFLHLIAVVEDVLATYQKIGLSRSLTGAGTQEQAERRGGMAQEAGEARKKPH